MAVPSYDELLAIACDVADEAGALVRSGSRTSVEVAGTKSSPIDVVTEVDRAAERLIRARLAAVRPGDGFLGEESGAAGSSTGITWIVDPIDGTVNFVYGIPQYAVSVAASMEDVVVAGAVVNVASGERFTATLGGGARCDGRVLAVREATPLSQRLVLTGFNYVESVRARQAAAIARLLPLVRDIRRLGSAALDLCAVGAGRADAYVEEGLNRWDMAAGALVATEAGARVAEGTGAGGTFAVVCAPEHGFDEFAEAVAVCGLVELPV